MRKSLRYAVRALAIAATVTMVSLAFLGRSSQTGSSAAPCASILDNSGGYTPADPGGANPASCINTECNSCCWSDGVHFRSGTRAIKTTQFCTGCDGSGCTTTSC